MINCSEKRRTKCILGVLEVMLTKFCEKLPFTLFCTVIKIVLELMPEYSPGMILIIIYFFLPRCFLLSATLTMDLSFENTSITSQFRVFQEKMENLKTLGVETSHHQVAILFRRLNLKHARSRFMNCISNFVFHFQYHQLSSVL